MYSILHRTIFGSVGFLSILTTAAADTDENWPREIEGDAGIVTIYQPQPEEFENNVLQGRAAASLLAKNATEPTFGVFWFTARVDTDRDAGTSLVRDIVVTKVRWPDSNAEEEGRVAQMLMGLLSKTEIPISLEQLTASLLTA
jgi:hypothetical protein